MSNKKIILGSITVVILGSLAWYSMADRQDRIGSAEKSGANLSTPPSVETKQAAPSSIIDLKDGQSIDLAITPVKKTIAGRVVKMLGYNGSLPGPTLRVPEGSEITVNLKNDGDIATTLHAHGVRMDNPFDGVPGVTQKEIGIGESFSYKLKFSDPGVFWYHPHVRTDYALESGLYANIIVTPKDTAYWAPVNREIPLMLDDIALDDKGMLPFDAKVANHTLMGRFGNVMLVNGETNYQLQAKQGEVVRLYLTNAANTRLFNFALPGAKMKLVGADVGKYEKETFVDQIMIAPGERRVVDVFFEKSGEYAMKHQTPDKEYALGKVSVSSEPANPSYSNEFSVVRTNGAVVSELEGLMNTYLSKTPDKSLNLSLDMTSEMRKGMPSGMHSMGSGGMAMSDKGMGMGDDGDALEWDDTMSGMNAQSTSAMMKWKLVDKTSGKVNMDIKDWNFQVGDRVKIRIFNDPQSMHPMQHPVHFHGQRLMVLSTNGIRNENPVWADTVLVAKGDTVDILLDATNPGTWMAHCHILEHAESGMMFSYTVGKGN
ncbi:multicopper oxidase family protein [Candidatus Dojkabacteria bacterium]|uniref:Multicopper oxidase family protein n=1 Tax=Candidatus Dojkabacteria bacterium TaxID=2099670 RepID=A0A5C7J4H3_9BACT|nr:MAG: multicopper oxidase family protein [Candidatus Dojkabacteria bacterium]